MVDIMAARNPRSRGNYTVGWICCLPIELAAAQMMFDAIHPPLPQQPNDQNVYVLGSIGRHNIAVAFLRSGGDELRTSADVARDLMNSFPSIQFSLLVGIGGGIPSSDRDIRLGDVVVAQPSAISGGVIQYELDQASSGSRFVQSGILKPPPLFLSTALMWLKETYEVERSRITEFLFTIGNKSTGSDAKHFIRPTQEDCLYQADYSHRDPRLDTCVSCDRSKLIPRPPRDAGEVRNPKVHFGQVASFNGEMRDGKLRDQLARDTGACCVEKGATGLMGEFRCLVIRGISDYADSHKNRRWQRYAAAAAAAFAKDLLSMISHHEAQDKRVIRGILPSEKLNEIADELKIRVNDWHGLEFNRFGKLLLHGQMSVGKDRETWQKLECYLFTEMLICVKEKKPSSCSLKASILFKKHLRSLETDTDDYILSLNLSVDELPYFYLRFDSPQQRELWRRILIELHPVEDLSRAQDHKFDHSEVEGNDSRHPSLPAENISGRIDPPSSTIPPTDSGYASISHRKFPLNTMPAHEQHQTHSYNDLQSITSDNEGLGLPQEESGIGDVEIDVNKDTRSIYTFQHGTSLNTQQIYISHLSEDLFNNVRLARYAHESPENIHSVLPRLLKGFALRLGQYGSTQMHRDIMIFIRRYRHDIASNLKLRYLEDEDESPAPANDDDKMELGDIMKLWYHNQEDKDNDFEHERFDTDTGPDASDANDEVFMEDYDKGLPGIEAYRELISNSQAYEWLLGSIQRELNLESAMPNTQGSIRKRILNFLPTPRTTLDATPVRYRKHYDISEMVHPSNRPIGAIDANYSIKRSWLRRPSPQCRFANAIISAGKPIEGGDVAIYGSKDVPFRIERSDYMEKLSWINKQYVLMWDVGGKRGWLVNGSCALLHLLLASIDFNRTDPLSSAFRLDKTSIKGPKKPFTSRSATEVLLNPDNLSLEIYHAQDGEPGQRAIPPVRIRHRVNLLYSMLEKMMDHQEEILGGSSEALRDMPRGRLEGWDFKDLATHEDPLYPRVCKLASKGKGWVDLSRAVRAITLFGNGFGEIIQPVPTSSSCSRWNRLPEGNSYLAISDGDLANIIDRFGNPNSNPVRLTNQLIWYKADDDLRACQCTTDPQNTKHCELAHVILPSHFRKRIPKQNRAQLEDRGSGAVVFGYNRDLRWSWSDTGFPVEELLPSSDDSDSDSDDDFHDSGLGTSLAPSAANDGKSEEMPSLRPQPDGLTHEDYEVGIVCALSKELLAVRALFDLSYPDLAKDENDPNCYCLGQIKRFKVVAAGLPHNDYGANSAANVASNLMRTFRRVKFCLLVGIGGGVPSATNDIRLGDIVVGTGVIQVDMGKLISDSQFQRTGGKQTPPAFLGSVITKIKSDCDVSFNSASNPLLDDINLIASRKPEYQYPGAGRDTLFHSEHLHPRGQLNCHGCTVAQPRDDRLYEGPNVFYGLIASGNHVVRDASHRDRLSKEDVICVEMEAAGVVRTTTNCLVIRGICDYSDSHKNKLWQEYAAATAAAYRR
ncbi:purine and uridine phosphorylase [Penicillium longicatenatum]|uniref:purine and uridine phosphorylase n=1 Tax=Penicillium longicatenatum TaxID=1561947 RepID=UPI00254923C6|nr:purine and uridine phosphorylase [Penicillium longicatenatum]KAJ5639366.1 purine and uridine phosphorylase [Penicillium longicatenatum]